MLDVLSGLANNVQRIEVASYIVDELEERRITNLPWPNLVLGQLANDAVTRIADNLTQGDNAPEDEAISYQIVFAVEQRHAAQLRHTIGDLYRAGVVDLPTLASRLISSRSNLTTIRRVALVATHKRCQA